MTERAAPPTILSWSGGKDSALALQLLRAGHDHDVVALFTSIVPEHDRVSVHGVRRALLHAQAERAGLPLHEMEVAAASSNGDYERAFRGALDRLRAAYPAVRHLAFGDLFLSDVRAYRERLLEGTGFEPVFPLWGLDTGMLAERFIGDGFEARLVCVDTTRLGAEFAGRAYDRRLLAEIPSSVDPCGERGEFHTFVSAGPVLSAPVVCAVGETVLRDGRFAYTDLV